ncbi:helix-turn-helix transcriptional regulator [Larkinella terrae]|uniref:Helix-turn-helix domain-containing protein n=1 Tax=Larkinella terrae TaxID=2025311 RepID=A0A7K0EU44_9BACT|nr:AraC family transcriptional regulator [Larkinella terrae]MRS65289.1 helix-turn-helix domain-containing protein [Larkinella terrae]
METKKPPTVPGVLTRLAAVLGAEVKNRRLIIPEQYGSGYCAGFVFNEHIRLMIMNYKLKEDLEVENPDVNGAERRILFKFQNVIPKPDAAPNGRQIPSVFIATSRINAHAVIPVHSNTSVINIEVDAGYLQGLFDLSEKSPVLQSLLENAQPLLFEEMVFPSLLPIVEEMVNESVAEPFELFFLRVKAEELICRLLMELEKRDGKQLYALNSQDIQVIYKLKEQVLDHLETPPVISDLAARAHMSPTKLKRLFRQIFGTSIFSYYQTFRMKEAARLLQSEKRSVSEVGYQLGFTNLSHFSRIFEKHIGLKPKKFSSR